MVIQAIPRLAPDHRKQMWSRCLTCNRVSCSLATFRT